MYKCIFFAWDRLLYLSRKNDDHQELDRSDGFISLADICQWIIGVLWVWRPVTDKFGQNRWTLSLCCERGKEQVWKLSDIRCILAIWSCTCPWNVWNRFMVIFAWNFNPGVTNWRTNGQIDRRTDAPYRDERTNVKSAGGSFKHISFVYLQSESNSLSSKRFNGWSEKA